MAEKNNEHTVHNYNDTTGTIISGNNSTVYYHESQHKIPSQLTSKLGKSTIVGREKELSEIDNLLKNSDSLLLINGIGGVGKSTIASYYLHSQKEKLDYYGFFEGLESFTVELRSRLNLKSEKPKELFLEALAKLSTLKGSKLLVLDDVKNVEENQEDIDKILALKNSGYKILITSREEIEEIEPYYLDVLSLNDAKALFNSICKVDDEALLEEILNYLDCHAFFVEKTAYSIKKTLTPQMLKEKFKNGEFSQISVKRKQNFNELLNQLFSLDGLDDEEILMLKQFSALPSVEIDFEFLETVFQKKEDSEFEELLDYLCEKGWLTKLEGSYKLHQIIKEYLLANHTPSFEEIEVVVDVLNALLKNSDDKQVSITNKNNIIYFESLVSLVKRLDVKNEKIGDFFNSLGLIYYYLGFYKKAKPLYLKALEIWKNVLGEEDISIASSYNNLAELYLSMEGVCKKVEQFHLKAYNIRIKVLGNKHLDTAQSANNLAGFYESNGEYKRAESFYLKALEISKKLLGESHPTMAHIYNNLAVLYNSRGEYKRAERLYLKALEIREVLLGKEHIYTVVSYNNLGALYESMGAYQKAESYLIKVLKIREKLLGEEHPDTATSYNNLALLYESIGAYKKAESFFIKALEIKKILLGGEHPDIAIIYSNLAVLYRKMGVYEKAESLYLKALKIKKEVLGEGHPDTAIIYNNLGVFYYGQENFEKAYPYAKKAFEIWSKILPKGHSDLVKAKMGLEMIFSSRQKRLREKKEKNDNS